MQISDFDYILPENRIAKEPLARRTDSKLLHFDQAYGRMSDFSFRDLPSILRKDDLLVFNDTRVLKARLLGTKTSGGKIECLIEDFYEDYANCMVKGKNLQIGQELLFAKNIIGTISKINKHNKTITFNQDVASIIDSIGEIPIPPYLNRNATANDQIRYQTVYAKNPGAIAAPTAGLHFDQDLITQLTQNGINTSYLTLHVGAGTFKPVTTNINEHIIHSEQYLVPSECAHAINQCRRLGGRVIAVGTTVMRTLETMVRKHNQIQADQGTSSIFITPGFEFNCVDALITNFHLPRSTLLMLVSAFMGHDNMHNCYNHALNNNYRFYSYGDAMLISGEKIGHNI